MKAIINCFVKNDLSIYNGLTFDIVGHCNGCIEVDINGIINDMQLDEIMIVDIQREINHSIIRYDRMFFDYWYDILKQYCKVNKIKIKPNILPSEKAERSPVTFEETAQSDNDIFVTNESGDNIS
jgi:hypothetical protein